MIRDSHHSLTRLWVLFLGLLVLHNLEELVLDLPAWSRAHPGFPGLLTGSYSTFIPGVLVVTLTAAAVGSYAIRRRPRWSRTALMVATAVLGLNALSHLTFSLITQTFMPGLLTSLLAIPFAVWSAWSLWPRPVPRRSE
ncbi:HXXEE domain-containing protein [Nesterenkonia alba]|uniref:HXXEE domain-containing protein n=1 Tax=Nesterenkonia alba TaxID=515814 RepID=UPI0003B2F22E|nr:HXXEE domain-containing protein [Nesterenkonia alba]